MSRDFYNWLAGFIDGEGCFLISYRKDRGHWYCQFRIRVRVDDEEIIKEIHEKTGIGKFFIHNKNKPTAPLACWEVSSRKDCLALIKILDSHPLRAKKLADYRLWKAAVYEWQTTQRGGNKPVINTTVWDKMSSLAHGLKEGRKYALD